MLKKIKESDKLKSVEVNVVINSSKVKSKVLLLMMRNKIWSLDSNKRCVTSI